MTVGSSGTLMYDQPAVWWTCRVLSSKDYHWFIERQSGMLTTNGLEIGWVRGEQGKKIVQYYYAEDLWRVITCGSLRVS